MKLTYLSIPLSGNIIFYKKYFWLKGESLNFAYQVFTRKEKIEKL